MKLAMRLLSTTILGVSLTACAVPVVIGVAATGAYMGVQERKVEQIALDTKIKIHIKDRLTNENYKYFSDIGVTVFENDILLTGVVPERQSGEKVLSIAQSVPDAGNLYNELFVGGEYTTKRKAEDAWISAKIKPRLIGHRQTFPINYLIKVVNGHVYIIGYVISDQEHEHVLHVLRTTQGVEQVHDYLRMSETGEDPREKEALGMSFDKENAPALPEDFFGN